MSENHNECTICLSDARLPVATTCGHIFCWDCIKNYINIKRKSECPVCKNGIKLDELIKIYSGNNETHDGENDNRPKQERSEPEKVEYSRPSIGQRILNNFGYYGYTNNTSYRPRNETEENRFRYSWAILIIIISIIIYIFNS